MATGMKPSSHTVVVVALLLQLTALRLRLSAGQVQWLLYFHFSLSLSPSLSFFFLLQLLLFICVWLLGSKAFRFYASHSLLLSYSFSLTHTLLRHSLFTARLELLSDDVDNDDDDAGRSCASMTIFWSNAAHTHTHTLSVSICTCVYMAWIVYVCKYVCVCVCVVLVPIFTQCLCKLQQYLQILSARAHKNDAAGAARGRVCTHTHTRACVFCFAVQPMRA